MEMEQRETKVVATKRSAILDKTTFMEKGIKNLEQFMWTQTKHNYNYDKHVEVMENWKDIVVKE